MKADQKDQMELQGVLFEGEGTSSWTRKPGNKQGPNSNGGNQPNTWQNTLHNTMSIQANGAVPNNTQTYYILDRDNVHA